MVGFQHNKDISKPETRDGSPKWVQNEFKEMLTLLGLFSLGKRRLNGDSTATGAGLLKRWSWTFIEAHTKITTKEIMVGQKEKNIFLASK